jgi:hypothetical protein
MAAITPSGASPDRIAQVCRSAFLQLSVAQVSALALHRGHAERRSRPRIVASSQRTVNEQSTAALTAAADIGMVRATAARQARPLPGIPRKERAP